jgi:kynurenine formamidase
MTSVEMDGFVGSVEKGGSVNTRNISFNPHGNGTHTECIGHLTKEAHQVDEFMREFIVLSQVHTVTPELLSEDQSEYRKKGDEVITLASFGKLEIKEDVAALVIRTSPNDKSKLTRVYTGDNPPYVDPEVMTMIREKGIRHLLIDLPSVDRESDGGLMKAHRAFWYEGDTARMHATITEMIYVPDGITDGEYLLNIMISPFGNDAAPSKPVLYNMVT